MRADETDVVFWERLVGMPVVEAIQELQERRQWAIAQMELARRKRDRAPQIEWQNLLVKINDELKYRNTLRADIQWSYAVKVVLGEEAWMQVAKYIREEEMHG